jgi:hypothetical protein
MTAKPKDHNKQPYTLADNKTRKEVRKSFHQDRARPVSFPNLQITHLRTGRSAPHRSPASKLIHCGPEDEQGNLQVHQLCALLPQLSLERLIIGD